MGFALASAVAKAEKSERIVLSCKNKEHAREKASLLGCASGDAAFCAAESRFIFLGVKPQMLSGVCGEIAQVLAKRTDEYILVSMLAGVSIPTLEECFGSETKIIRIMPNTPVSVGRGMILYCTNDRVTAEETAEFLGMLRHAGETDELPEQLFDAGSALSGCGPAFCYQFADALASGAVKCGLPREKALRYALVTLCGAAKLALVSGQHPARLKDDVCSPGGSTIEGVAALEKGGFGGLVMEAVEASYRRTGELGRQKKATKSSQADS